MCANHSHYVNNDWTFCGMTSCVYVYIYINTCVYQETAVCYGYTYLLTKWQISPTQNLWKVLYISFKLSSELISSSLLYHTEILSPYYCSHSPLICIYTSSFGKRLLSVPLSCIIWVCLEIDEETARIGVLIGRGHDSCREQDRLFSNITR